MPDDDYDSEAEHEELKAAGKVCDIAHNPRPLITLNLSIFAVDYSSSRMLRAAISYHNPCRSAS
jgi:hypothetical protein